MRRLALIALLLAAATAAPARADQPVWDRYFQLFDQGPSTREWEAARCWAPDDMRKAETAGYPAAVRAARADDIVIIRLESPAVCDVYSACPTLIFRDITRKPVLNTRAFANVVLRYDGGKVFALVRRPYVLAECALPPVGPARCRNLVVTRPEAAVFP